VTHGRLSLRALNRAALHRQLLLDRAPLAALDAVGRLTALQAQAPLAPYVGLWTRLAGFGHEDLNNLLSERAVLRAHLMRNTVHLVDAADYVRFRPLYQPCATWPPTARPAWPTSRPGPGCPGCAR